MKLLRSACAVLSLNLVLLAGSAAAQSVHVVDGDGGAGVDFLSVQAAADAAADGDVLLVLTKFQNFFIDNAVVLGDKSLVIVGIQGTSSLQPRIGKVDVQGLSAGKFLIVRGMRIESTFDVTGCEGAVLAEDCFIEAGSALQSSHVVFTRCEIDGTSGVGALPNVTTGGPGLVVEESTVALYDCEVTGGNGGYAQFIGDFLLTVSTEGGQGLHIWSGTVLASGTTIEGGQGGGGGQSSSGTSCIAPKKGGAGVRNYGHLIRLDTTIAGGLPGFTPPCAQPATQGADLLLLGDGTVSEIPEQSRSVEITSPVETNGSCQVTVHGQPGDNIVLLQSLVPFGQLHAGLKGVLAGQPPYFTFLLGTLGIGGTLSFDVHLPPGPLPGGIEAVTLIEQVLTGADSGGGLLSAPSIITLVNDLP